MLLHDRAPITTRTVDARGILRASARLSRVGIQHYMRRELGLDGQPDELVAVYRPPSEVLSEDSLRTYRGAPLTLGHPAGGISASRWRELAVGNVVGDALPDPDGIHVVAEVQVGDKDAVDAISNGTVELSCGYLCDIRHEGGVTPDGEPFSYQQVAIRIDHVAIVEAGRCGGTCRISDCSGSPSSGCTCGGACGAATSPQGVSARLGGSPVLAPSSSTATGERAVPDESLRTVVVDGVSIHCTPQSAEVITKLQRQLSDAAAATDTAAQRLADAEKAHRQALDGLEGQLAALRAEQARLTDAHAGEIAGLKAAHEQALESAAGEIAALRMQTSDEAVEARVAARSALVAQARRILGDAFDPAGKTDADIRKAAVVARLGDKVPQDAGDSYMVAAFDTLVAIAPAQPAPKPDPLRQVIAAGGGVNAAPMADADPFAREEEARKRMIARDLNAWKHTSPEAA